MKTSVQTFTVTAEEAGQKLLQYLSRRLVGAVPQAALQRFIRTGQVRVDGRRAKPFSRLEQGQTVRVPPYETEDETPTPSVSPQTPALDILHEDDDLLVVVKPAGLPVHPGTGQPLALTTILAARHQGAPFKPTPAHRLDRDTTGLVLVAKSYRALRAIHEAMLADQVRKDYLTWVQGQWLLGEENEWVTLTDQLAKQGGPGRETVRPTDAGKLAVSKARLLLRTPAASLLEVRLETGRTHQIRTQLASRGYPILGDAKYGGGKPPLLLHAWRIVLPDAAFTAPPPWPAPWSVARLRGATTKKKNKMPPAAGRGSPPPGPS